MYSLISAEMESNIPSSFCSSVLVEYGKNVDFFRNIRCIPFWWDRGRLAVVAPTTRNQLLEMRIQKWFFFLIIVAHQIFLTINAIRYMAGQHDESKLKKILEVGETLLYWSFLSAFLISFGNSQAIPTLVCNVQQIASKVVPAEGLLKLKCAERRGLSRVLASFRYQLVFGIAARFLPILWKPKNAK